MNFRKLKCKLIGHKLSETKLEIKRCEDNNIPKQDWIRYQTVISGLKCKRCNFIAGQREQTVEKMATQLIAERYGEILQAKLMEKAYLCQHFTPGQPINIYDLKKEEK